MSPQAFDDCVASGGRVITKTLSGGRYIRICYPKGNYTFTVEGGNLIAKYQ